MGRPGGKSGRLLTSRSITRSGTPPSASRIRTRIAFPFGSRMTTSPSIAAGIGASAAPYPIAAARMDLDSLVAWRTARPSSPVGGLLPFVARAGDRNGAGDGRSARVEHAERDVHQRGELDVAQIASLVEALGDVDDLEPAPLGVPALENQPVDAWPVEGDGEAAVLACGQARRSETAVHADELLHLGARDRDAILRGDDAAGERR